MFNTQKRPKFSCFLLLVVIVCVYCYEHGVCAHMFVCMYGVSLCMVCLGVGCCFSRLGPHFTDRVICLSNPVLKQIFTSPSAPKPLSVASGLGVGPATGYHPVHSLLSWTREQKGVWNYARWGRDFGILQPIINALSSHSQSRVALYQQGGRSSLLVINTPDTRWNSVSLSLAQRGEWCPPCCKPFTRVQCDTDSTLFCLS